VNPSGAEAPMALALRGISKRFGDTVAIRDASLSLRPGTIHAVLGENGAGKSTLMRVAYGTLEPDAGEVAHAGQWTPGRPRQGIGMVHQHLSLVPALTALDNFQLGGTGRFDRAAARRRLEALSGESGLRVDAAALVRDMTLVQQQRLEILKALGRDASILILDEPSAVLAPAEARDLLAWVRSFATGDRAVLLVTHKLREALAAADEITVLRRGTVTWSGPASGSSESELARAIFPDAVARASSPAPIATGRTIVGAKDVRILREDGSTAIGNASLEIRGGEIIGVAAVEGSGQHELLLALADRHRIDGGTLALPDEVAYVPADRTRDAVVAGFSLTENVALRGAGRRRGVMPWARLTERTSGLIERFAITAPGPDAPAGALSGGNQQRLVVARELHADPALVVADNPTRGLDLNATAFVLDELRACAARGSAVVLHSSDLDEILTLATRVVVVFAGRVTEAPMDRESIGRAMLGAA
jgi:ABC-type uncharacterized transport system ATPase subunit